MLPSGGGVRINNMHMPEQLPPIERHAIEMESAQVISELLAQHREMGSEIEESTAADGTTHYRITDARGKITELTDLTSSRASVQREIEMRPKEWLEPDIKTWEEKMRREES